MDLTRTAIFPDIAEIAVSRGSKSCQIDPAPCHVCVPRVFESGNLRPQCAKLYDFWIVIIPTEANGFWVV